MRFGPCSLTANIHLGALRSLSLKSENSDAQAHGRMVTCRLEQSKKLSTGIRDAYSSRAKKAVHAPAGAGTWRYLEKQRREPVRVESGIREMRLRRPLTQSGSCKV